jgi:hypothetical protein
MTASAARFSAGATVGFFAMIFPFGVWFGVHFQQFELRPGNLEGQQ